MPRVVQSASYDFAEPVGGLVLDLRLGAAPWEAGRAASELVVVPPPAAVRRHRDAWGNAVERVFFGRATARIAISALATVSGPAAGPPPDAPAAADLAPPAGAPDAAAWRSPAGLRPVGAGERGSLGGGGETDAAAVAARVAANLAELRAGWRYAAAPRPDLPLAVVAAARQGRCLELARVLVWRLRAAAIPARFVVGYALGTGRRGAERERHAWIAYHDGLGWVEIDPAAPERRADARLATAWGPAIAAIEPVHARRPHRLATRRAEWSTQIDE